jgi:hypothetical protein
LIERNDAEIFKEVLMEIHRAKRLTTVIMMATVVLACAGVSRRTAIRQWPGGSEQIPIVDEESVGAGHEVILVADHPGIEVVNIREIESSYARMTLEVWVRNSRRMQEMVEVKAKFFDEFGTVLDAASDWAQVFVEPGEAKQVQLSCLVEGARTYKVLVR